MADKKKNKKIVKKITRKEEEERELQVGSGRSKKGSGFKSFVKIKVIGVGGAGGNALTRMADDFVRGVELIAINTDLQDLEAGQARHKLHIGETVTKGMGAGMNPELGRQAAEENREEIAELLKGADMVFLTAGFGGGTGTGATPVVAEIAREKGILTVAVVTKPFTFEGQARMRIAEEGIVRIKDKVDTLLIIPNDRIFNIVDNNTSMVRAFEKIDEVLKSAVQGVAEIITSTGLVNVDFADVKAIMAEAGNSIIGVGVASGNDRAVKAANQAISSQLLETSIEGAKGLLFGVAGGRDMRISEINEAAKVITENVDPGAKIIFGAYHDRRLKAGQLKITLIATGFNGLGMRRSEADSLNLFPFSKGKPVEDKLEKEEAKEGGKMVLEAETEKKKEEDALDVPAFMRRKKK